MIELHFTNAETTGILEILAREYAWLSCRSWATPDVKVNNPYRRSYVHPKYNRKLFDAHNAKRVAYRKMIRKIINADVPEVDKIESASFVFEMNLAGGKRLAFHRQRARETANQIVAQIMAIFANRLELQRKINA